MLWKHNPNEQGLLPIYLKITVERKTSYIATGHFSNPKAWDEKKQLLKDSHPSAKIINPELTHRKNELSKKIVELQITGKDFSAKTLKALFTGKDLTNIFNFIDQYCEEMKHKRSAGRIEIYKKHQRKLLDFTKTRNVHFEDIDHDFLYKFDNFIMDKGKANKTDKEKQQRTNYASAIFSTLRTWFNEAKKRRLITNYPFSTYETPVYKSEGKDYLSLDELKRWEQFADETNDYVDKQASLYFLLGCYSGLRISDWHKLDLEKNVVNGHIKMIAEKNKEQIVIPINVPLRRVLDKMKGVDLISDEPVINRSLKRIAKKLEINKNITSHCGRKTFAVTMCAERGISSETCAKLMAITVKTCVESYYKVTAIKIEQETQRSWKDLD
jgi:integrase/recombinase XerD